MRAASAVAESAWPVVSASPPSNGSSSTTCSSSSGDGRREEFDREKLLAGMRRACEKRPLPAGVIEAAADDIESRLRADGHSELPSRIIGELVMERLRELDHIAYIRFASVYRSFQDIDELKQELAALEAHGNIPAPQFAAHPRAGIRGDGEGRPHRPACGNETRRLRTGPKASRRTPTFGLRPRQIEGATPCNGPSSAPASRAG